MGYFRFTAEGDETGFVKYGGVAISSRFLFLYKDNLSYGSHLQAVRQRRWNGQKSGKYDYRRIEGRAGLKGNLCDFEDMHSFTFQKTTVHIGAEMAQNMQAEFEEECRKYQEQIEVIEKELKNR